MKSSRCTVCAATDPKYCCPRCLIPYCSSICYRKHGADCTENFYKDKVREAIEFEKMLKKNVDEHDHEESKLTSLAEKLFDSGLDTSLLNDQELELMVGATTALIKDNQISTSNPWWIRLNIGESLLGAESEPDFVGIGSDTVLNKKIYNNANEFVGNVRSIQNAFVNKVASVTDEREQKSQQSNVKLSPNLKYHVLGLLLCYVTTMRCTDLEWSVSINMH